MTTNVLQICQSCAENNGGQWKNPRNTAPLFLATCGVCKEIRPLTHIQFWKGIKGDQEFKLPTKEPFNTPEDKNAKRRAADQARRDAKKAKQEAAIKPSQSGILNGEK